MRVFQCLRWCLSRWQNLLEGRGTLCDPVRLPFTGLVLASGRLVEAYCVGVALMALGPLIQYNTCTGLFLCFQRQ